MNNNEPSSLDRTLEALRAVGEQTRLRIVLLCAHGELTVSDLTTILGQSQPRVSRHLKLLHEAGVLERHQEGQSVWFRSVTSGPFADLVRSMVDQVSPDDSIHADDLQRLKQVTHTWEVRARSYFRKNYANWDREREKLVDSEQVNAALDRRFSTLTADTLLDVGTGTGHILKRLGRKVGNAVGLDNSRDMLLAARAAIHKENLPHCQLRHGDMANLPFEDTSFDAVSMHLSLHYAESPQSVLQECARVTVPGGALLLVDFDHHDDRGLMAAQGHCWPGFHMDGMKDRLLATGYENIEAMKIAAPDRQKYPDIVFWFAQKQ